MCPSISSRVLSVYLAHLYFPSESYARVPYSISLSLPLSFSQHFHRPEKRHFYSLRAVFLHFNEHQWFITKVMLLNNAAHYNYYAFLCFMLKFGFTIHRYGQTYRFYFRNPCHIHMKFRTAKTEIFTVSVFQIVLTILLKLCSVYTCSRRLAHT